MRDFLCGLAQRGLHNCISASIISVTVMSVMRRTSPTLPPTLILAGMQLQAYHTQPRSRGLVQQHLPICSSWPLIKDRGLTHLTSFLSRLLLVTAQHEYGGGTCEEVALGG
jgi:hypothetical protein